LRHGLEVPEAADLVEQAIAAALDANFRTADLALAGELSVSTSAMGEAVARLIEEQADPGQVPTTRVTAPASA
jgi:Isocitrate/isopropylmalate dehydrogenase